MQSRQRRAQSSLSLRRRSWPHRLALVLLLLLAISVFHLKSLLSFTNMTSGPAQTDAPSSTPSPPNWPSLVTCSHAFIIADMTSPLLPFYLLARSLLSTAINSNSHCANSNSHAHPLLLVVFTITDHSQKSFPAGQPDGADTSHDTPEHIQVAIHESIASWAGPTVPFRLIFAPYSQFCQYLHDAVRAMDVQLQTPGPPSPQDSSQHLPHSQYGQKHGIPSAVLIGHASEPMAFDLDKLLHHLSSLSPDSVLLHHTTPHHSLLFIAPSSERGSTISLRPSLLEPLVLCPATGIFARDVQPLKRLISFLRPHSWTAQLAPPPPASTLCELSNPSSNISCVTDVLQAVPNMTSCVQLPTPRRASSWESCQWMIPYTNVRRPTYPYAIGPPCDGESHKTGHVTGHVTLTSNLSPDRLERLEEIVRHWDGPISVAVHAEDTQAVYLWHAYRSSPTLQHRRDLSMHLMTPCGNQFPANHLRNLAVRHVTTPYVLVVDIDNIPTRNLRDVLTTTIRSLDPSRKVVATVAAFEYEPGYYFGKEKELAMPENKTALQTLLASGKAQLFKEKSWSVGYGPYNRQRFMSTSEAYKIQYGPRFEPYFMIHWPNKTRPLFDPTFVGWGCDKAISQLWLHLEQYEYIVIPDAFVFHMDGPLDNVAKAWGFSHDKTGIKAGIQTGDQSPGGDCNEYRCQKAFKHQRPVAYGEPGVLR